MAVKDQIPEVTPVLANTQPDPAPTVVGGVEEYASSEEFQRAHAAGIKKQKEDEAREKALTDKAKVKAFLKKYIAEYEKNTTVQKLKKKTEKDADYALDVCTEVVEILQKIKTAMR